MTSERVAVELLKLMVQLAWADHEVVPDESIFILDIAERVGASEFDMELFRQCLRDEAALPAPDLALLRHHKDAAMEAARQVISIDGRIARDEREMLAQLEELLTPTS